MALDDPADTYRGLRGDRTPLGFDLEWDTDGLPFRWPEGMDRYEIPCNVHGEILVGDERIEFEGPGQRDHSWGVRDWWDPAWCWTAFRLDDGTRIHAVTTLPPEGFGIGYVQPGDRLGRQLDLVTEFTSEPTLGDEAIPTTAELVVAGPADHRDAAGLVARAARVARRGRGPLPPGHGPLRRRRRPLRHRLDRVQPAPGAATAAERHG